MAALTQPPTAAIEAQASVSPWTLAEVKPIEYFPNGVKADGEPMFSRLGFPCVRFTLVHKAHKPGQQTVITYSNHPKGSPSFKVVNSLGNEKKFTRRAFAEAARAKYGDEVACRILLESYKAG